MFVSGVHGAGGGAVHYGWRTVCGTAVPHGCGQAEIDGTLQQITGLACQQPDGSWQVVDGGDTAVALYPAPLYPYYDPWYWGGVVAVGFGGPFIFVDRFHHRHPLGQVHFSRAAYGFGTRSGGWHGSGTWQSTGSMHGGWGGGGGMRR